MPDLARSTKAFMDVWRIVGSGKDAVSLEVKYLLFGLQHNVVCTGLMDVAPLADRPTLWVICDPASPDYGTVLRWIPEADRSGFPSLYLDAWAPVDEASFKATRTRMTVDYQYVAGPTGEEGPSGPPGPPGPGGPLGLRGVAGDDAEHKYIDKADILDWARSNPEFTNLP